MKIQILTSLLLTLFATTGCFKKNTFQAPPAPEVTVQNPEQKDVTVYQSFPGRLVASDSVEIRARVQGFLQSIDFEDGQRVKKGDLLFTIEPEQYEASVNSAKAQLAQAEAKSKLADSTLKRTQQAYKTLAVSELDVSSAEAEMQSAEAYVMEAKAALDNANLQLSYTKIYSPIDGRVHLNNLSVGNVVSGSGSEILTTVVVEAPIDVFFTVDERRITPFLQKGTRQGTADPSKLPPVKLELADGTQLEEEGNLNYIDPTVDPTTGTLQARACFKNSEFKLLPGLYGKIMIPSKRPAAILIPEIAIQQDLAGAYVLVVNAEKKVESRYITRGEVIDSQCIVTEGLTAEDQIIVEGIQRARPGIEVRIAAPKTEEK